MAKTEEQLERDRNNIRSSATYFLIAPYPRLFSSAWLEAGLALEMGKPCLFLCRDVAEDLPWVVQTSNQEPKISVREFRLFQKVDMAKKVEVTLTQVQDWSPFHCQTCYKADGPRGHIGSGECAQCRGKGFKIISTE